MKFSIQVNYKAHGDDGKDFRARTIYQVEATSDWPDGIKEAYKKAEKAFSDRSGVTFGAIIPGWHNGNF